MFDIEKTKIQMGIEKSEFEQPPRAIPAICAIPEAENSTNSTNSTPHHRKIAFSRLQTLAAEFRLHLDELLDWYRDDMDAIAGMPPSQLRAIVTDYLQNRDYYRNQQRTKP